MLVCISMKKSLKIIFFVQIILFLLVILFLFTPLNEVSSISASIFFILFSLMGIVFTFLVKKNIEKGKLRKVLLINGLSAFGVLFFSVLHNLVYALTEIVENNILTLFLGFIGGTFFILGVLISPIVFLIASIFTIVLYIKKNRK